ncbi:hypothetical protein [Prescottella sp. R16]|uniref:hypothetical protein n=1 Tax=Prescottella sp. R16 TaxID=3064529 RepID=UPI00272EA404|nr:hypothetical protein [Prescottella sp. R16]
MPDTTVLERYQNFRTRRFLRNEERYRHWLPRWRTRRRRRLLVVVLAVILTCMAAVGGVCLVDMTAGALLWVPAVAVFLVTWTTLQIVSGRQGDAPRDALDEWELQQRDSARSIGLTVTQVLTFLPAAVLVVTGSRVGAVVDTRFLYAAGLFVLTTLIVGACTPAMILAWTRPDPETDDRQETE